MFDVTMESMFGMSAPTPLRLAGRTLQCKQKQTMERYIELLEHICQRHKLDRKLAWIELALDMVEAEGPNAPALDNIESYANKLDGEHVQIYP